MALLKLYTIRAMDFLSVDSVTSEATGHPIERAFDHNLETYWEPTSTADQTIIMDLNNDLHERITAIADRDFSSATGHWVQNTMNAFAIVGGDLNIAANASGQYCYIQTGFEGFVQGESYRITYDYVEHTAGFQFRTNDDVIGTCAAGTDKTLQFVATTDATQLRIQSTSSSADGEFDNISVKRIDNEAEYDVQGYGLWIYNYNTYFLAMAADLDYSDDGTNWTNQADRIVLSQMGNVGYNPLKYYIWATAAQNHRYWRLILDGSPPAVPKIGQIFLFNEWAPGIYDKYPRSIERSFGNQKSKTDDGRLVVEPGRRSPIRVFSRRYTIFDPDQLEILQDAFDACRGGATPLMLCEGSNYYIVRLATEVFEPKEIDHQVYDLDLEFYELAYVYDEDVS